MAGAASAVCLAASSKHQQDCYPQQKLPEHLAEANFAMDDWPSYEDQEETAELYSSDEDLWDQLGSEDDDQGVEEEEEDDDGKGPGWRTADVLNEAVPDLYMDLLSADERSTHMRLPLGNLSPAQAVAVGLHHGLSLDYRLSFRGQKMGVGKASRQAQLFPGRRVIWQLATMLQRVLQEEWGCIANGKFQQAVMWVRLLHKFMKERITNLGNYCLICGKAQDIHGLKPVPCGTDMCCHRHDELGFGADLHEVVDNPAVADLLITLAAAASCDTRHRDSLFVGAPSDFVSNLGSTRAMPASETIPRLALARMLPGAKAAQPQALLAWQKRVHGTIDFRKLNAVFAELPSVDAMSSAEDLEGFLQNGTHGRSMYRLVRWILSTNRGYLLHLPPEKQIPQMNGQQFYLMTNSPERETAFQKLKKQHGSFWKFHGSAFHNWHSILRTNLRNVSHTSLMRAGAAHGPGIYLASNSQTSMGYCSSGAGQGYSQSAMGLQGAQMALGLCEVAQSSAIFKNDIIAVADENAVALRYLFIYGSTDFPSLNASSLNMGSRPPPI
ncbi:hypothetical protein WJX84_004309 [Apatococcus fuscideae]|uniref:PARP catalytic domain-containing protein n=1 Tax=Apatococcus fuscideae TaxID=2026836 RepID=A0AAW1TDY6_9CHLO